MAGASGFKPQWGAARLAHCMMLCLVVGYLLRIMLLLLSPAAPSTWVGCGVALQGASMPCVG